MTSKAKVICVLREGGEYDRTHVARLARQVEQHAPVGTEFICLENPAEGWPGWWAKMALFKEQGPLLYLDLHSTLVGSVEPLLELAGRHEFICLRDFNYPQREVQSSVMAWRGDLSHLYRKFTENPQAHMAENSSARWWGDQGFIERHQPERSYWQDLVPGQLVSFKKHVRGRGLPPAARVIVFHGKPRPWEQSEVILE